MKAKNVCIFVYALLCLTAYLFRGRRLLRTCKKKLLRKAKQLRKSPALLGATEAHSKYLHAPASGA